MRETKMINLCKVFGKMMKKESGKKRQDETWDSEHLLPLQYVFAFSKSCKPSTKRHQQVVKESCQISFSLSSIRWRKIRNTFFWYWCPVLATLCCTAWFGHINLSTAQYCTLSIENHFQLAIFIKYILSEMVTETSVKVINERFASEIERYFVWHLTKFQCSIMLISFMHRHFS